VAGLVPATFVLSDAETVMKTSYVNAGMPE
jgi:hypothetical protein